MTNREYLNSLDDSVYALWLCKQMWNEFDVRTAIDLARFHAVRNFLGAEMSDVETACSREAIRDFEKLDINGITKLTGGKSS